MLVYKRPTVRSRSKSFLNKFFTGMARKDFLDIVSLDRAEIIHLLDQAVPFKDLFTRSVKKVPALKGKTVLMLFMSQVRKRFLHLK